MFFHATGMHDPLPADRIRPPNVLFGPRSRLKSSRNFSWMTEILWMNLNLIELLTNLQLITIRNSSDGNSIKPQATKRLFK